MMCITTDFWREIFGFSIGLEHATHEIANFSKVVYYARHIFSAHFRQIKRVECRFQTVVVIRRSPVRFRPKTRQLRFTWI